MQRRGVTLTEAHKSLYTWLFEERQQLQLRRSA
jgi:hypothetical protein